MKITHISFTLFFLLFISGCGSIHMKYSSMSSHQYPIHKGSRFNLLVLKNCKNKLIEEDLLLLTKYELEMKGYVYDPLNSDFNIVVSFVDELNSQYIKPVTRYRDVYIPGELVTVDGNSNTISNYGTSYNTDSTYTYTTPGQHQQKAYTTGGYTQYTRTKGIAITAVNNSRDVILWEGKIFDDDTEKDDFYKISPCLVTGVLSVFPSPRGNTSITLSGDDYKYCIRE